MSFYAESEITGPYGEYACEFYLSAGGTLLPPYVTFVQREIRMSGLLRIDLVTVLELLADYLVEESGNSATVRELLCFYEKSYDSAIISFATCAIEFDEDEDEWYDGDCVSQFDIEVSLDMTPSDLLDAALAAADTVKTMSSMEWEIFTTLHFDDDFGLFEAIEAARLVMA